MSLTYQEVLQKQSGEPLIILKMRFSVLKCLVEFMYCGKTQCLEENLDELVSAAQFLKIKGLSKVTKEGLGITKHSKLVGKNLLHYRSYYYENPKKQKAF